MLGLTTALLGRACRTFLELAYPPGEIPSAKQPFHQIQDDHSLEPLLVPPLCQTIMNPDGTVRGYALRLGCETFPHMKLQVVECEGGVVFSVDTHDAMVLPSGHPDAGRWSGIQDSNRRIKQEIETAWETEGLTTFHSLLRKGLGQESSARAY